MPGTIIFKPIEANLNLGSDVISKADPYCQFTINGQKIKGQACKSGGKHPIWEDTITIPASTQPTCFVELKDKDILIDEKLGSFEIDLREIESQGRLKKWYPIFHKDKPAGEILMEAVLAPQGGLSQGVGMGTAMPMQTIPTQTQTIPIQSQTIPAQTMGMPVTTTSTTMHSQGMMGAPISSGPIVGAPVTHTTVQQSRDIGIVEAPFQVPSSTQTTHVIKETVIAPGLQPGLQQHQAPIVSQQIPIMSQQIPMTSQQYPLSMTDTALLNPSMTESLSEYYAREALIRGVDPLGTRVYPEHSLPLNPLNTIPMTQSVGLQNLLPGQNLPGQQSIGQTGVRSQLPGQPALLQQQLPGQQLPGQASQNLPGQIQPNQF